MRKVTTAAAFLILSGSAFAAPAEPLDILETMIAAPFVGPGEQLSPDPEAVRVSACEIRNAQLGRATCSIIRRGSDVGTIVLSFGLTEQGQWRDLLPAQEQEAIVSRCGDWDQTGCWAELTGYPLRTLRSADSSELAYVIFLTDVEFVDPPKD